MNNPLVVVSSYTRFNNLAHGPTGTEAKHSMWTYRLNTSNGQMTLVSVNAHESNTPQAVMNPAFSRVHPYKTGTCCITDTSARCRSNAHHAFASHINRQSQVIDHTRRMHFAHDPTCLRGQHSFHRRL